MEDKQKLAKMKHKTVAIAIIVTTILAVTVFAHPGNTDGNGGHYNRSSGEYHYHHGYPEHQHENGICPYVNATTTAESTKKISDSAQSLLEARAKQGLLPLSFEDRAVNLPSVTEQEDEPSLILTIGTWVLNILIALYLGIFFVVPIIGGILQWIIDTLRELFARIFKK